MTKGFLRFSQAVCFCWLLVWLALLAFDYVLFWLWRVHPAGALAFLFPCVLFRFRFPCLCPFPFRFSLFLCFRFLFLDKTAAKSEKNNKQTNKLKQLHNKIRTLNHPNVMLLPWVFGDWSNWLPRPQHHRRTAPKMTWFPWRRPSLPLATTPTPGSSGDRRAARPVG